MGFLTHMWNDYSTFASAGGPFRWAWMLMWTVPAVLLVLIGLKTFVKFLGRNFMTGYREAYAPPLQVARRQAIEESQRRELLDRLAADIRQVTDRAAQPSA
jgi:hypothetical protein